MRKLVAVLSIVMAFASYAEKAKSKEKHFEDVVAQAAEAVGTYEGPSESYGLVLEIGENGALRGNYVEMGRVAVLNAIELNGSEFEARASFDDGSSRTIKGSFAVRVLNGARAFGLHMRAVPVDGLGAIDTFFEKM